MPYSTKTIFLLSIGLSFYSGVSSGRDPVAMNAGCNTSPHFVSAARSGDATGQGPVSVAVDPLNRFVYRTNAGANTVSLYTIDAKTGALTHRQDIAAGPGRLAMAITQGAALVRYTPKFAYVSKKSWASAPRPTCPLPSQF